MKTRKIKTPSPPTKKTRRVLFDSPSSPEKGGRRRTIKNKKRHNK
jgi:hypothetical protein